MGDTSHLHARIIEEFPRRVNEAPDLDSALKERITKLATTNPEHAKTDQIRTAIVGDGDRAHPSTYPECVMCPVYSVTLVAGLNPRGR